MTQPPRTVDEMLTELGTRYRAYLDRVCPPERQQQRAESLRTTLQQEIADDLNATNTVVCCLCLTKRPRRDALEAYTYPADQCVNVRKPWHYHRAWTSRAADQRARRRHRRRIRRGRLPHAPAASTGQQSI